MQAKKAKSALLFIDTNILLDFYRVDGGSMGAEFLSLMDQHKEILITGSQVAMEFKKNRQSVISTFLKNFKTPDFSAIQPPPFLKNTAQHKTLLASQKAFASNCEKIRKKISSVISSPASNDPVYSALQKIFQNKSPYNLDRSNDVRHEIRELAKKRFLLGYPPRKDGDTSIGDAINWEWIIHCAAKEKKNVIIVTRDHDYGHQLNLNDWLKQEFKERVSSKKNVYITNSLSAAFKMISVSVKQSTQRNEQALIKRLSVSVNETNSIPLKLYEPGLPGILQALSDSGKLKREN